MDITKVNNNINDLDADTQLAVQYLLKECEKQGIPIKIHETYRSQERQNYLYCQGRSVQECINAGIPQEFAKKYARTGQQVTWTLRSEHKNRRAIDFIHKTKAYDVDNSSFWLPVAKIAKEIGFDCGYFWKKQDRPHLQLNPGVKPKKIGGYKMEKAKIKINGKEKVVDVIKENNQNFVKLRDLESDKITIGYDDVKKTATIDTK